MRLIYPELDNWSVFFLDDGIVVRCSVEGLPPEKTFPAFVPRLIYEQGVIIVDLCEKGKRILNKEKMNKFYALNRGGADKVWEDIIKKIEQ